MSRGIAQCLLMLTALLLLAASGIHIAAVVSGGHLSFLILAAIEGVGGAYLRRLAVRL